MMNVMLVDKNRQALLRAAKHLASRLPLCCFSTLMAGMP